MSGDAEDRSATEYSKNAFEMNRTIKNASYNCLSTLMSHRVVGSCALRQHEVQAEAPHETPREGPDVR